MGCQASKSSFRSRLSRVDDSIHVMLEQERRRQVAKNGEQPRLGYRPRSPLPHMKPMKLIICEEKEEEAEYSTPLLSQMKPMKKPIICEEEEKQAEDSKTEGI
jgi:hypothetical protein